MRQLFDPQVHELWSWKTSYFFLNHLEHYLFTPVKDVLERRTTTGALAYP
jgi:hypothetical protein